MTNEPERTGAEATEVPPADSASLVGPAAPGDADRPDQNPEETESAPSTPRGAGRLANFFLLTDDLRDADTALFGAHSPGWASYERSCAAAEAADVLLVQRGHLRLSDGTAAAVTLFREAAWWALVARHEREGLPTTQAALDQHLRTALPMLELARHAPALAAPHDDLSLPTTEDPAVPATAPVAASLDLPGVNGPLTLHSPLDLAPDAQQATLASLRVLTAHLIEPLERDLKRKVHLRFVRVMRLGVTAAVVAGALAVGGVFLERARHGPNLAAGRPTTVSSHYTGFPTSTGAVDGNTDVMGFHTDQDPTPWLTVDLGAAKMVRRAVVYNRQDYGDDRVAPLVIETSTDGVNFTEVARNDKVFVVWRAALRPTQARYVRFKIARRNYLHLNEVEIYGS